MGVLRSSQFKFIGAFKVPPGWRAHEGDAGYCRGLTHRYVNGELRLLTAYWKYGQPIHEFKVPTLVKTAPWPTAPEVRNWGTRIYGGLLRGNATGLYWDEEDKRLYWNFQSDYTTATDAMSFGYSELNDADGSVVAHGRFGFAGASPSYKAIKGITPIPEAYRAKLNGKRLAVGFGGGESNVAAGPANIGPMLAPFDHSILNSINDGNLPASAVKVLIEHPYHANKYGSPFRALRNTNYKATDYLGWDVKDDVGYWTAVDQVQQSALWIDTGKTQGFIVFCHQVMDGSISKYKSCEKIDGDTWKFDLETPLQNIRLNDQVGVPDSTDGATSHVAGHVREVSDEAIVLWLEAGQISNPVPRPTGELYRGAIYTNGQIRTTESRMAVFIYDSETILSGLPVDRVPFVEEASWSFPTHNDRYPSHAIQDKYTVQGLTIDYITNRLYALVQSVVSRGQSMVYVWQLNEEAEFEVTLVRDRSTQMAKVKVRAAGVEDAKVKALATPAAYEDVIGNPKIVSVEPSES